MISEQTERSVLEEGLLHHMLVFFQLPERLPGWMIWFVTLLIHFPSYLVLQSVISDVRMMLAFGLGLWLFSVLDLLILLKLPKRGISFGPWKSQFIALSLPRAAAAASLAIIGLWIGWKWAIGITVITQLVGTVALIWGAVIEPFRLVVTEQTIATDRLSPTTRPIRMLHISDLHVERLTRREELLLAHVERLKPDLIVLTGDYLNLSYNSDPLAHAQVRQMLGQLVAPFGVYATLGSPPVDVRHVVPSLLDGLPIKLMRDEWTTIDLGQGRNIVLIGLDCSHHIPTDQARLDRLMGIAPNRVPQVLLYHSPELMPQASAYEVDLYVCGHTHGGQVRLPVIGPILTSSQLGRKYVMGLYRKGRTHLYVSRGVGLEGLSAPRVRFLAPPEITLFTLTGC